MIVQIYPSSPISRVSLVQIQDGGLYFFERNLAMLLSYDISNKDSILAQSNEDLLQSYIFSSQQVSDLIYMTDYADYKHEDYWHIIKYLIEQELLRRMGG